VEIQLDRSMPNLKTKEQFIADANETHGEGKYSFPNTEYNGNDIKVRVWCISCSKEFEITPSNFLSGKGCRTCGIKKCSIGRRSNIEEFKKKAIKKHGEGRYSFPNTEYNGNDIKVQVWCNYCSKEFEITPANFLYGQGCRTCGIKKSSIGRRSNIEEFKKKAIEKHGEGRYSFPNTDYIINTTNVVVLCNLCSKEFSTIPRNFLSGQGCPGCCNKTEGKLFIILSEMFPSLLRQFKQDWCKNITHLPFDFCIPEYNIIIELDGRQHFQQVSNWRSPEEQFKIDMYKEECANDNGYSLIRLVQEDVLNDYYDWMSYLLSSIEEIRQSPEIMNMYLCRNGEYDKY
jgi:very-short-patch-repair endonuclease/Zn finger protein HypA/HybF involved in hydrogenase expression